MSSNPRQILVVDDHPLTRKGLCDALNEQPDFHVCGEAESWREALTMVRHRHPDVLILDLNLKDGNGWTLLDELRAAGELPPTLVLSVCDEEVYAHRLLQAGAMGYLMKDTPIAGVLAAIRKLLAGHVAVSDNMASLLIQPGRGRNPAAPNPMELLSDRELQVFELITQGYGNKETANRLGISHKTISTYKARLMEKMGVRTTHELITRIRAHDPPG